MLESDAVNTCMITSEAWCQNLPKRLAWKKTIKNKGTCMSRTWYATIKYDKWMDRWTDTDILLISGSYSPRFGNIYLYEKPVKDFLYNVHDDMLGYWIIYIYMKGIQHMMGCFSLSSQNLFKSSKTDSEMCQVYTVGPIEKRAKITEIYIYIGQRKTRGSWKVDNLIKSIMMLVTTLY